MKLSNELFHRSSKDHGGKSRICLDSSEDTYPPHSSSPPSFQKRLSFSDFSTTRLFSPPFLSKRSNNSPHRFSYSPPQHPASINSRRVASYTVQSSPSRTTYRQLPNEPQNSAAYTTYSSFPNALFDDFSPNNPLDTDPFLTSPGNKQNTVDSFRPLPETPVSPGGSLVHPLPRPPLPSSVSSHSSPYSTTSSTSLYSLYNDISLSCSPEPYLPLSPTRSPARTPSPIRLYSSDALRPQSPLSPSVEYLTPPNPYSLKSDISSTRQLPKIPVQDYASGKISSPLITRTHRRAQSETLFSSCREPWLVGKLYKWCKEEVFTALGGLVHEGVSRREVAQVMATLFTIHIASMEFLIAEIIAKNILGDWINYGLVEVINLEKLQIAFTSNEPPSGSGVLPFLTNGGCYSYICRSRSCPSKYQCYSCRCARNSSLEFTSLPGQSSDTWSIFWNISSLNSLPSSLSKREIARQNNIHELICKESDYVADLNTLAELFRDGIVQQQDAIVPSNRVADFIQSVFGNVESIRQLHSRLFLPQLIMRERLQGPVVSIIGDILLEWIHAAKSSYINYAKQFPLADETYKLECQRNTYFARWLAACRSDPRCRRLDFQHFLQRPTQRLQRYTLELDTILKHTEQSSWDFQLITQAVKELRATCEECDAVIATVLEANRIRDLSYQLLFKNHESVNLELRDPEREFFFEGIVQRRSDSRLDWLDIHLFLLDNYLIMAKARKDKRTNASRYVVSKRPIPLDLLVLSPKMDDFQLKSNTNKFLGSLAGNLPQESLTTKSKRKSKVNLELMFDATAEKNNENSMNSAVFEKSQLYPFTIRHLGAYTASYTLYVESLQLRKLWVEKINVAKKRHSQKINIKNPFALKVVSDVAFQYPPSDLVNGNEPLNSFNEITLVEGSSIDRALNEVAWKHPIVSEELLPEPIAYGDISCIAQFNDYEGHVSVLIATSTGIFLGAFGDSSDIRDWKKISSQRRVTQLGVVEEFDILLELRDKTLYAHKLSRIIEMGLIESKIAVVIGTPHAVSFFKIGKLSEGASVKRERTLVFYKEGLGNTTTIICCEPVIGLGHNYQKTYAFKRKDVTSFRTLDDFHVTANCHSIDCFKYSIALCHNKGIDVLRLDPKLAVGFPSPSVLNDTLFRNRINNSKPLGVFRIHDPSLFACCYQFGAVFVNGEGSMVNKECWFDWIGKPNSVTSCHGYLIAFNDEFVEIWNTRTRKLNQIIQGNDIKYYPSNSDWLANGKYIMFGMVHPQYHDRHLILALNKAKTNSFIIED
ncbi:RhoGEF Rgf3 [Schizosaccharomyces pombe]|uniref:Rho1 guanine nucleotide exchange factor 3 n=1 Tax=Schizosaccharomyces pombe (strain 972 / ATCC 24843) TaxID=284812 RepID=RGF3_SCHPO|nr:RhoGEF Rgf3 [Schizosaccharomyces pombe]Q9Y7U5.1 RecName: Full=Rho1 guanine nucleotide exchange factor 3; AltName: Full=Lethal at division protein 1 [Schizosaccharomyces pombe 972h-]CAB39902.1 RhoGEF Rgf3 [Schizosaccharomyces pombe]|eukprot:NP_588115.1 RhoGEF Rgf3 [Schizosaccharomyces pombe]